MDLQERIIMKHILFENYQEECIKILHKFKPHAEIDKYTASVHDYIMSIANPEDFNFYKAKPRGNVISCKYIADKLDSETECKVIVLKDLFKYEDPICLHLIQTDDKEDTEAFIRGIKRKLSSLDIEIKVIHLKTIVGLLDYVDEFKYSNNPFIILKPLSREFEENIDEVKILLNSLDNVRYRDIDCFLNFNTNTKLEDCKLGYVPTTAAAVIEIFKEFCFTTRDYKHVYVLGQSNHLGKPIADIIEFNKYSVFTANRRTSEHIKKAILYSADIIISVTGSKDITHIFNGKGISTIPEMANRCIIDVGIVNDNGKIRGDITNDIKAQYKLYNKVPNGVGLIDTSIVALRTVESYYTQLKLKGEIK